MNVNQNIADDMTLEDYKLAFRFLPDIQKSLGFRSFKKPNFSITFFGGEPLLCIEEMMKIASYTKKKFANIFCSAPTNALLLDSESKKSLENTGIYLSISYDGPFSLDRINNWRPNDFLLHQMKVSGVKAMVSPYNVANLYNNFLFFVENGIKHLSMSIVRDTIWTGDTIDELDSQLKLIYNRILRLFETTKQLYLPEFFYLPVLNTFMSTISKGRRGTSCFAGTSGVAIFGNGDIYPCARFGANEKFLLGNYKTKYLNYDNIQFLQEQSNISKHSECVGCPISSSCNMGCFYSQLEEGNWKTNKTIPNLCRIYKKLHKFSYQIYQDIGKEKQYTDILSNYFKY